MREEAEHVCAFQIIAHTPPDPTAIFPSSINGSFPSSQLLISTRPRFHTHRHYSTMAAPPPAAAATSPAVQRVAKKSSDQLLRKFAHLDSPSPKIKSKRRCSIAESHCRSPSHGSALVERRSLLPPAATRRSALLRQLGIARARLKARDIRNRSLFGTLEKTWRSTVEGASRVFMEKHYHRHKRLINDIV